MQLLTSVVAQCLLTVANVLSSHKCLSSAVVRAPTTVNYLYQGRTDVMEKVWHHQQRIWQK